MVIKKLSYTKLISIGALTIYIIQTFLATRIYLHLFHVKIAINQPPTQVVWFGDVFYNLVSKLFSSDRLWFQLCLSCLVVTWILVTYPWVQIFRPADKILVSVQIRTWDISSNVTDCTYDRSHLTRIWYDLNFKKSSMFRGFLLWSKSELHFER